MHRGFTLIEMIVIMGILFALMTLTTINLIKPQASALLHTTMTQLLADLSSQQLRSMGGDTDTTADPIAHSVYLGSSSYTLFRGAVYSSSDTSNFTIPLDPTLVLSTNFPDTTVTFQRGSGDVSGFTVSTATITLTHTPASNSISVTLNQYGTVISEN